MVQSAELRELCMNGCCKCEAEATTLIKSHRKPSLLHMYHCTAAVFGLVGSVGGWVGGIH